MGYNVIIIIIITITITIIIIIIIIIINPISTDLYRLPLMLPPPFTLLCAVAVPSISKTINNCAAAGVTVLQLAACLIAEQLLFVHSNAV
jgi:hypothetical protein